MADVEFRLAREADLETLVGLLFNDPLGATREKVQSPLPACYAEAFNAIQNSADNELILATINREVVGMLQLTVIPCLTHQGTARALLEGVRVAEGFRDKGIGRQLLTHTIEYVRGKGCGVVQLTTDLSRTQSLQFYLKLGFEHTHAGMKLRLL